MKRIHRPDPQTTKRPASQTTIFISFIITLLLTLSLPTLQAKTLVVYYSYTGNCRAIANALTSQITADVLQIQPAEKGLRYEANNYALGAQLLNAIKANPNEASSYPVIDPVSLSLSDYQNIVIVTPLWWSQMAAPMQTFLFNYASQMAGKNVGLIVSSTSSPITGVEADCKRLLPGGNYYGNSLWIRSSQVPNAASLISDWLQQVNFSDNNTSDPINIKVSDGTNTIVYQLNHTSAAKALYAMLPFEVSVDNYSNNEKIFYPPTPLSYGSDCIEGDCPAGTLALFSPWGNVVMYYGPASRYSGLYILGNAIEGTHNIRNLTGTIRVEAAPPTSAVHSIKAHHPAQTPSPYTLNGIMAVAGQKGVVVKHGQKVLMK